MTLEYVQEWYAKKLKKTVAEMDEYDMFCAHVAYTFFCEQNNIT